MSRQVDRGAPQRPAESEPPAYVSLDRQRALHAFDWGVLAAVVVALVYGLLWGGAVLTFGLIAVAVMGGWLVGAAVRRGAWKSAPHLPDRRLKALAALLAVVAWFGGAFVAYLLSRALLPESGLSFPERLEELPFSAYLTQQYEAGGPLHAVALAVMAFMGWRSAR